MTSHTDVINHQPLIMDNVMGNSKNINRPSGDYKRVIPIWSGGSGGREDALFAAIAAVERVRSRSAKGKAQKKAPVVVPQATQPEPDQDASGASNDDDNAGRTD